MANENDLNIYGAICSPIDERDYKLDSLITYSAATLPSSYRIPFEPPLFNQGSVGCCVACAVATCRYIQEQLQENHAEKFSVNYIFGNRSNPNNLDGMDPRTALDTLVHFGDCHWEDFKGYNAYSTANKLYIENKEYYDDLAYPYKINSYYHLYTTEEIKTAVYNLGCAIVVYDVTDYLRCPIDGYVIYDDSNIVGQHCVTIVGWTEDDHWIVVNSWGSSYGINGYCYVPFSYPIIESWAMVDDNRYDVLIFKKKCQEVSNIYFGIKK